MENKVIYTTGGGAPSVPSVDKSVDPVSDFYSYVNRKWQRHIHLPSYEDSFGVSEEIEMDVRDSLLEAIGKYRTRFPSSGVSMLASSFLHQPAQASAVIDLQRFLNTFDCIKDSEGVAEAIGRLNKIQSSAPISFVVNSDYYDSKKCCVYLYETSLGLPSKHYYLAEASKGRIILKYSRLLQELGKLMNIEALESAISIEARIVPYLSEGDMLSNVSYVYNPHTFKELILRFPDIPWRAALLAWGLSEKLIEKTTYVITNVKYFNELNKCFRSFSLDIWRTWLRAQACLSFVRYLPPPFDDMHYELFDKMLKGIAEKLPQKNLTLNVLMTYAPQDLSRMFVGLTVEEGTKAHAKGLVKQLQAATLERIEGLRWMEHSTKHIATKKVRAMQFAIGYPEKWESETDAVTINMHRPLQNIFALAGYDTQKMIADLESGGCKKSAHKWNDGAFEVNAYYYPEGNLMVVPAGILRPPFFDLARSNAWNLGGIGAAIGHEITHAFDDDGRLFDEEGNYEDWWSESDARTYKKMTQSMIELFEGQSYMGGKVNGKLTLSENLADLGGLSIALNALKKILPKGAAEQKKAYKEFFISYAVSWRQKDRPKKAKQALLLDVHAPPPLRVNLIVRQFQEFYDAFDISEKDPNYIPVEQRIVFW